MSELKTFYCVRFNRRNGKIDKTLSGLSNALLRLWALQNTTKSKDTIIFDEDGLVIMYFEGTGDFPNITKYGEDSEEGIHFIDEFCEGLLEKIKENK